MVIQLQHNSLSVVKFGQRSTNKNYMNLNLSVSDLFTTQFRKSPAEFSALLHDVVRAMNVLILFSNLGEHMY